MKITLTLLAAFLLWVPAFAEPMKVTVKASSIFDRFCSHLTKAPIKERERAELTSKLPLLQQEWDKIGDLVVEETQRFTGHQFSQKDMEAVVFLCKKFPSLSAPLLINANFYIGASAKPLSFSADVVYHELLHNFLVDNYSELFASSKMIKKYSNEGGTVLSHLHLMALQKTVYERLGWHERIAKVIDFESANYGHGYKRTWEIVLEEGAQAFIDELLVSH